MVRVRTGNRRDQWREEGPASASFRAGTHGLGGTFVTSARPSGPPVKPKPEARQTCRRGHPWTPENTYWQASRGVRICRICKDRAAAAYRQRQRRNENGRALLGAGRSTE